MRSFMSNKSAVRDENSCCDIDVYISIMKATLFALFNSILIESFGHFLSEMRMALIVFFFQELEFDGCYFLESC